MRLLKDLKSSWENRNYSIRLFKRQVRFAYQRMTRGWDDGETFSLDKSLAILILPRLKRFKELKRGCPGSLSSIEEWEEILDDMIFAFEFSASEEIYGSPSEEKMNRVNKGLALFATWFNYLWW